MLQRVQKTPKPGPMGLKRAEARHNLSGSQYQAEWKGATKSGYRTRNVTGYSSGNSIRYATVWRK